MYIAKKRGHFSQVEETTSRIHQMSVTVPALFDTLVKVLEEHFSDKVFCWYRVVKSIQNKNKPQRLVEMFLKTEKVGGRVA